MVILNDFNFIKEGPITDLLLIEEIKEDVINYESFLLINPITEIKFPEFDKPFFDRMDATLKHVLYQYGRKWITSERQIFYSSNECLTTIQFLFRKDRVQMNVFQRSSNLNNLKEDIEFLNYFLKSNFKDKETELNIFVSFPHTYRNKATKVD